MQQRTTRRRGRLRKESYRRSRSAASSTRPSSDARSAMGRSGGSSTAARTPFSMRCRSEWRSRKLFVRPARMVHAGTALARRTGSTRGAPPRRSRAAPGRPRARARGAPRSCATRSRNTVAAATRHPRRAQRRSPARGFSKEQRVLDAVTARARDGSDDAIAVAADQAARSPAAAPVFSGLRRRGAAVHIIGSKQVTSDLPERATCGRSAGCTRRRRRSRVAARRAAADRPRRRSRATARRAARDDRRAHARHGRPRGVVRRGEPTGARRQPKYTGRDILTHGSRTR